MPKVRMVERVINGQVVTVKVCPPSRRRAAGSIQPKSRGEKPIRLDKRPGRDAAAFARQLSGQVSRHLSLIPVDKSILRELSGLSDTAFEACMAFMVEVGTAKCTDGGIISGTMTLK